MRKLIGLYLLLLAGASCAADAPVEDLGAGAGASSSRGSTAGSGGSVQGPQNQALTNLHFEVQSLREEVRELRGIVEVQANELQQLKQRQLDDFQDLDRRISAMGAGEQPQSSSSPLAGSSPATGSGGSTATGSDAFGTTASESGQTGSAEQSTSEGEYEAYTTNYNLLKARKIDEAVAGFNQFVAKFPNGQYTANAYYWLGEIYLLQNELDKAGSAFGRVVDEFPAHPKANDAKFKLAKVYHLQGSDDRAKSLLTEVADTNSGAASLARAYLNDNF